jgi:branched-subunit amino acid transport protein
MKVDPAVLFMILGMGVATYLPRCFPLFFLSGKQLPHWLETWLDFIPVAVLSALVLPALVIHGEPRRLDLFQPDVIVAIPTFLFALKTRSMAGTVVVGMGLYWLAKAI